MPTIRLAGAALCLVAISRCCSAAVLPSEPSERAVSILARSTQGVQVSDAELLQLIDDIRAVEAQVQEWLEDGSTAGSPGAPEQTPVSDPSSCTTTVTVVSTEFIFSSPSPRPEEMRIWDQAAAVPDEGSDRPTAGDPTSPSTETAFPDLWSLAMSGMAISPGATRDPVAVDAPESDSTVDVFGGDIESIEVTGTAASTERQPSSTPPSTDMTPNAQAQGPSSIQWRTISLPTI